MSTEKGAAPVFNFQLFIDKIRVTVSIGSNLDVNLETFCLVLLRIMFEPLPSTVQQYSSPAPSHNRFFTMKLDPKGMRYLTPEDWRVLTAVCIPSPIPLSLLQSSLRQSQLHPQLTLTHPGRNRHANPRTSPHNPHRHPLWPPLLSPQIHLRPRKTKPDREAQKRQIRRLPPRLWRPRLPRSPRAPALQAHLQRRQPDRDGQGIRHPRRCLPVRETTGAEDSQAGAD